MSIIIEVKKLSFAYIEKKILSEISFSINKGEIFGIIGPNGSGKSTLLRAMSGLFSKLQGQVFINNKNIFAYRKKELARFIAFVEQHGIPYLNFTVEEIVAMGRYPWQKPFKYFEEKDMELVKQSLENLAIWDKRHQPINTLSGGERQLVSLARAMAQEPKLLFLDEPTTYLDINHQLKIMQHIHNWQKERNLTVVMVLHDLNLAAQYCTRLLLMEQGEIKAIGNVKDVLNKEKIEKVYKTKPIMIEHPVTKVPQILLN